MRFKLQIIFTCCNFSKVSFRIINQRNNFYWSHFLRLQPSLSRALLWSLQNNFKLPNWWTNFWRYLQCTLHFRVSISQISYLRFIGLKHVFWCKKNKFLMYFDILIKIMLYKWNPSTYTDNKDISANQIWSSFEMNSPGIQAFCGCLWMKQKILSWENEVMIILSSPSSVLLLRKFENRKLPSS